MVKSIYSWRHYFSSSCWIDKQDHMCFQNNPVSSHFFENCFSEIASLTHNFMDEMDELTDSRLYAFKVTGENAYTYMCSWFPLLYTWNYHNIVNRPCMRATSLLLCLTLCNPMDCSPPESSVHGDSPGKNPGVGYMPSVSCIDGWHWQVGSLPLAPPGKPINWPYFDRK